ncbi:MAG: YdcF family protein [Holosporaceae bacterium]|jgi:hypothetical protein|nr:YdcF family protein [Holosporaceae bacterium]
MRSVGKYFVAALIIWMLLCGIFVVCIATYNPRYDRNFDYVVILTGEYRRIAYVFRMMSSYQPKSVFISGAHEKITLRDICPRGCYTKAQIILGKQSRNTVENAVEVYEWIRQNNISEILLITSDYHLPRSLLEFKFVDNELKAYPCAVKSNLNFQFIVRCCKEFHKIIYTFVRHTLRKARNFLCI